MMIDGTATAKNFTRRSYIADWFILRLRSVALDRQMNLNNHQAWVYCRHRDPALPPIPGGARHGFAAAKPANSKEPPVRSYITVYPGSGGACGAAKKCRCQNNHASGAFKRLSRGSFTGQRFRPGESAVGFATTANCA
jgi:hypothetical protein